VTAKSEAVIVLLDGLSRDELKEVGTQLRARWNDLATAESRAAARAFHVGQKVSFQSSPKSPRSVSPDDRHNA